MPRVFQYGSNVNLKRLEERVGPVRDLGRHDLPGYAIAFEVYSLKNNCAAASMVEEPDGMVIGRLFQLSDEQVPILDKKEGVRSDGRGNYRRIVLPNSIDIFTYVVTEAARNPVIANTKPASWTYLEHIATGLRRIGAPEEYIEQVVREGRPQHGLEVDFSDSQHRQLCVDYVLDNPEMYKIDALGLVAHLRSALAVEEGDSVEVNYQGRTHPMRVKKAPQQLVEGKNKTLLPVTISRAAREVLGIPPIGKRDTDVYTTLFDGVKLKRV